MNHFFAILHPSNNRFSDQRNRVIEYYGTISQKENFSMNDSIFSATCFRHESWNQIALPTCQRTHFTFVGSARLDNWKELGLEFTNEDFHNESALILALFEKYGIKAFEKLIGDFSFIIWDSEKQQVYTVKDPMGIRPLFYYQKADLILFSSSISAIRAFLGFENVTINQAYVAKELKNFPVQIEETFFNEIHRLKPAHFGHFQIGESRLIEKRYWVFTKMDTSSFSTRKQVLDELRRLFRQAVESRLRGAKKAATQLSGGLDSSAITVLASQIIPKKKLHTFSFVLSEKTRAYSESGIDEMNTQNSILNFAHLEPSNHHLSHEFYYQDTFHAYDKSDQIMGGLANSDSLWQDSMYKEASAFGIDLILSGFLGDEGISTTDGMYYFDYFFEKNWSWIFKQAIKNPYEFSKKCYHYYFSRWMNPKKRYYEKIQIKRNLLDPNSTFETHLRHMPFSNSGSFRQRLVDTVFRAHSCLRTESEGLYAIQYGISTSYPMGDLRFLQFALSLPVEYFNPKEYTRPLFRSICEGILPEDVRLQPKYNGAMTLAFAEYWIKEQIRDFKSWRIKNSLQIIDTNKVFDETDFEHLIRKAFRYKVDYLIEKNIAKGAK